MDSSDKALYLVIFIVIVLYLISMINRFSAPDLPETIMYAEPHKMNNGDLLCVSYNNAAGAFVGSFTHSVWVHTGIIWVDPITNVRYVLEGAMYGSSEYQHFFKIPVATWLYINKANVMGYKKYHGPELDSYVMMECFKPFEKHTKLEGLNVGWLRFLVNRKYKDPRVKSRYTCFEVTVIMGQLLGIFSKEKHFSSYFPRDVVDGYISCCDEIYYEPTIQIALSACDKSLFFADMLNFPK